MKIKITRPVFISGETKKIGEIIEVTDLLANELIVTNAAIKYTEEKQTIDTNGELQELKAKADALGVKYADNVKAATLKKLIEKAESALVSLKAKADELGIEYTENVTVDELTELIQALENGDK